MERNTFPSDQDGLLVKGSFSIQVIDVHTDQVIDKLSENNLVVTLGQTNIAKLLGGDAAGSKISKIGLGTSGATPALADSALTAPFSKLIESVSYPTLNSVRITWAIDASEANGMTIREFGLLNVAGALIARKVRTDIVKTADVRLVGSWTITIN